MASIILNFRNENEPQVYNIPDVVVKTFREHYSKLSKEDLINFITVVFWSIKQEENNENK